MIDAFLSIEYFKNRKIVQNHMKDITRKTSYEVTNVGREVWTVLMSRSAALPVALKLKFQVGCIYSININPQYNRPRNTVSNSFTQ